MSGITHVVVSHLQTARFRQFWDEAAKSRHIVEVVPGTSFHDALRPSYVYCLYYISGPSVDFLFYIQLCFQLKYCSWKLRECVVYQLLFNVFIAWSLRTKWKEPALQVTRMYESIFFSCY